MAGRVRSACTRDVRWNGRWRGRTCGTSVCAALSGSRPTGPGWSLRRHASQHGAEPCSYATAPPPPNSQLERLGIQRMRTQRKAARETRKQRKQAVTAVQAVVRGWLQRSRCAGSLAAARSAAIVMQRWWRAFLQRRAFAERVQQRQERAACIAQSWWRGVSVRRVTRQQLAATRTFSRLLYPRMVLRRRLFKRKRRRIRRLQRKLLRMLGAAVEADVESAAALLKGVPGGDAGTIADSGVAGWLRQLLPHLFTLLAGQGEGKEAQSRTSSPPSPVMSPTNPPSLPPTPIRASADALRSALHASSSAEALDVSDLMQHKRVVQRKAASGLHGKALLPSMRAASGGAAGAVDFVRELRRKRKQRRTSAQVEEEARQQRRQAVLDAWAEKDAERLRRVRQAAKERRQASAAAQAATEAATDEEQEEETQRRAALQALHAKWEAERRARLRRLETRKRKAAAAAAAAAQQEAEEEEEGAPRNAAKQLASGSKPRPRPEPASPVSKRQALSMLLKHIRKASRHTKGPKHKASAHGGSTPSPAPAKPAMTAAQLAEARRRAARRAAARRAKAAAAEAEAAATGPAALFEKRKAYDAQMRLQRGMVTPAASVATARRVLSARGQSADPAAREVAQGGQVSPPASAPAGRSPAGSLHDADGKVGADELEALYAEGLLDRDMPVPASLLLEGERPGRAVDPPDSPVSTASSGVSGYSDGEIAAALLDLELHLPAAAVPSAQRKTGRAAVSPLQVPEAPGRLLLARPTSTTTQGSALTWTAQPEPPSRGGYAAGSDARHATPHFAPLRQSPRPAWQAEDAGSGSPPPRTGSPGSLPPLGIPPSPLPGLGPPSLGSVRVDSVTRPPTHSGRQHDVARTQVALPSLAAAKAQPRSSGKRQHSALHAMAAAVYAPTTTRRHPLGASDGAGRGAAPQPKARAQADVVQERGGVRPSGGSPTAQSRPAASAVGPSAVSGSGGLYSELLGGGLPLVTGDGASQGPGATAGDERVPDYSGLHLFETEAQRRGALHKQWYRSTAAGAAAAEKEATAGTSQGWVDVTSRAHEYSTPAVKRKSKARTSGEVVQGKDDDHLTAADVSALRDPAMRALARRLGGGAETMTRPSPLRAAGTTSLRLGGLPSAPPSGSSVLALEGALSGRARRPSALHSSAVSALSAGATLAQAATAQASSRKDEGLEDTRPRRRKKGRKKRKGGSKKHGSPTAEPSAAPVDALELM